MKKITTALSLMLLLAGHVEAQKQIANSGFELWDTIGDYTQPKNWYSLNALSQFGYDPSTIITTDAHSGQFAVVLESKAGQFNDYSGVLCTGPILNSLLQPDFTKMKIPFTSKPDSLKFYFKSFPKAGDTSVISMYLTKWNSTLKKTDTIANAAMFFTDSIGVYTNASIPFIYSLPSQPDSMFIIASSSLDGFNPTVGSKLILDDLLLVYNTTGLASLNAPRLSMFPNPATSELVIESDEQLSGTLRLFSINGVLVHEQFINAQRSAINVSNLNNGIYFMRLQLENNSIVSQKMIVQH